RSSLITWLRAVLAQRFVDRVRVDKRIAPMPEDEGIGLGSMRQVVTDLEPNDPHRSRYAALVRWALRRAIARLTARDRLRLAGYYVQSLTLAEVGRLMREHEATVSRQLAR